MSDKTNVTIIYDGECPFCSQYVQFVNIKNNPDYVVRMKNAREHKILASSYKQSEFDLNDGMIVIINDQLYYGSDAVHAMAMLASSDTLARKINFFIFRHKTLSYILYPLMKAVRTLTLKIMGRKKINTD